MRAELVYTIIKSLEARVEYLIEFNSDNNEVEELTNCKIALELFKELEVKL
jgi:hypothetical protein